MAAGGGEKPRVIRVSPAGGGIRAVLEPVARDVRERGALAVYPTDTLYGLGANPFSRGSVLRVYRVKRRPLGRPLPVLVSSLGVAERLVVLSREARLLAERFWPGALTLVLPLRRGAGVPVELHAGSGRLAVRMPAHRVALALIELAGGALVGTSANRHGAPHPRTAGEAVEQLDGEVDYVVDAGPAPLGAPSTVVDLSGGEPRVLREGAVPAEAVLRVLASLGSGV